MNCEELRRHIIEAIYGELPPTAREAFDGHLAACEACRREFAAVRDTSALLDHVPTPETRVDVTAVYRDAAARTRRSGIRWRRTAVAAAAAVVLLTVFVGARSRMEWDRHGLHISWGDTPDPMPPRPAADDYAAALTRHAEHLATLDETVRLLLVEIDQADRQSAVSLDDLRRQIAAVEAQNTVRWRSMREDFNALYGAQFAANHQPTGTQP